MPSKRGGRRSGGGKHQRTHRSTTTLSATSTCNLPQAIVTDILTRLPVRSLIRFRCVCKSWLRLLRTPKFIKMHLTRRAVSSLITYSIHRTYKHHTISLLPPFKSSNPLLDLPHPYPELFYSMELSGSYNGMVCLSYPPLGYMIILWNPATRMYKPIPLSHRNERHCDEVPEIVSVGLGFDTLTEDYKVVRVLCMEPKENLVTRVEVYSANVGFWKQIKPNLTFHVDDTKCSAIVKGVPYWTAVKKMEEDRGQDCRLCHSLVGFDVHKEVFRDVPMLSFLKTDRTCSCLVELKDCLGMLVYSPTGGVSDNWVDVWMFGSDGEQCWDKKFTVGPITSEMKRVAQCSKNGVILGEDYFGKLFLYDPATKGTKEVCIEGAQKLSLVAFDYTESLAFVKEMKQVGREPLMSSDLAYFQEKGFVV